MIAQASYIAGVGDRHYGNFMLDYTDGTVVGIDFGYSFDIPQSLPVPELHRAIPPASYLYYP